MAGAAKGPESDLVSKVTEGSTEFTRPSACRPQEALSLSKLCVILSSELASELASAAADCIPELGYAIQQTSKHTCCSGCFLQLMQ